MSEINILVKQLEYCINLGYEKPAKEILLELIHHKAKINFSLKMNIKCASHSLFFNQDFYDESIQNFRIYPECSHAICATCLYHYITSIFNRLGLDHPYTCPGCNANYSASPTRIPETDINYYIPVERQEEWKGMYQTITMQRKSDQINRYRSVCYYTENPDQRMNCINMGKIHKMPNCSHRLCDGCIDKGFMYSDIEPPLKCFVFDCPQQHSNDFILSLLVPNTEKKKNIYLRLGNEEFKNIICPNCSQYHQVQSCIISFMCNCGNELCPRCGKLFHGDIPCIFAQVDNKEYKEIQCYENDAIPEFRYHFTNAVALFSWDMHVKKKEELMIKFNSRLEVKTVIKIVNPVLQDLYDKAKKKLKMSGINPDEKFVFHATQDIYYQTICKEGFKIGGIDVNVKIGKVYGYGVYTATDPTMSMSFYSNKKILLCKGLTGKKSANPINNKNELLNNTEYHSYFKDFKGTQSNYYVFFKREYVLPFYYIEYE